MPRLKPFQTPPATHRQSAKWPGCSFPVALLFTVILLIGGNFLLSEIRKARDLGRKPQCKTHLKQLGLALHNYHDEYGCFPPAFVADELGRPMHSWRVLLLPYLDQAPLYNQYRFDEPWDGPNNRRLADRMEEFFSCPVTPAMRDPSEPCFTSYVAVVGPETAWPGTNSVSIKDIKDGMANTLLLVEVANSGIQWMEPRDLHVLQMAPSINSKAGQGISSRHPGGVYVLLADGAVRFEEESLSPQTIRALLTIDGGEKVVDEF